MNYKDANSRTMVIVTYIGYLIPIPLVVLIAFVANLAIKDKEDRLAYAHHSFMIATFWWSLLWGIIVIALLYCFPLSFFLVWVYTIWYIVRVVKGLVRAINNKLPIEI